MVREGRSPWWHQRRWIYSISSSKSLQSWTPLFLRRIQSWGQQPSLKKKKCCAIPSKVDTQKVRQLYRSPTFKYVWLINNAHEGAIVANNIQNRKSLVLGVAWNQSGRTHFLVSCNWESELRNAKIYSETAWLLIFGKRSLKHLAMHVHSALIYIYTWFTSPKHYIF